MFLTKEGLLIAMCLLITLLLYGSSVFPKVKEKFDSVMKLEAVEKGKRDE